MKSVSCCRCKWSSSPPFALVKPSWSGSGPRCVRVSSAKRSVVGRVFLEATMLNFGLSAFFHFKQLRTISVRTGGGILGEVKVTKYPVSVSPIDRIQHNDSEHNVNNHLDVSVLPLFRTSYQPSTFNVRASILARPHKEIGNGNNKTRKFPYFVT